MVGLSESSSVWCRNRLSLRACGSGFFSKDDDDERTTHFIRSSPTTSVVFEGDYHSYIILSNVLVVGATCK